MRLHDTNIAGLSRVPAHLDLLDFTRCVELRYRWEDAVELVLRLASDAGDLELALRGVRSIRIPELSPWFWTSELEIDDLRSQQLEGIKFRLIESDGDRLAISCEHIECLSFTPST